MLKMRCECSDPGCQHCYGKCKAQATTTLFRIDMSDETGTPMCDGCCEDAMDSGVFTTQANDEPDADECSCGGFELSCPCNA
jgi:hypothetical protein